jgi:hypothetical protein
VTTQDVNKILQIIKQSFEFLEHRFIDSTVLSTDYGVFSNARQHSLTLFNSVVMGYSNLTNTIEVETVDFLRLYSEINVHYGNELLKILPLLTMKSRQLVVNAGSLLLLPHHRSTEDEIRTMMIDFESFLLRMMSAPDATLPRFITIAKSTDDGYTPPQQATLIYDSVIEIIMRVFSLHDQIHVVPGEDTNGSPLPSDSSSLSSVGGTLYIHDLCEDAISKAHSSLLRASMIMTNKMNASGTNSSNKRKAAALREHGLEV